MRTIVVQAPAVTVNKVEVCWN